jgi:hypothetical protein
MARPKKQIEPIENDSIEPIENDSVSPKYNKELVATLVKYPHINCVYMDKEGNWHFAEKPGFTAISREDILNG